MAVAPPVPQQITSGDLETPAFRTWCELMRRAIAAIPTAATISTQDEGVLLSSGVTTLNFTGAGISASGAGATTTVNVAGSGSGAGFDYGKFLAGRFGFPGG